jgi:hypothetical protein
MDRSLKSGTYVGLKNDSEAFAMGDLRQVQGLGGCESSADFRRDDWIDDEIVRCNFQDEHHGKRLRQLLEQGCYR